MEHILAFVAVNANVIIKETWFLSNLWCFFPPHEFNSTSYNTPGPSLHFCCPFHGGQEIDCSIWNNMGITKYSTFLFISLKIEPACRNHEVSSAHSYYGCFSGSDLIPRCGKACPSLVLPLAGKSVSLPYLETCLSPDINHILQYQLDKQNI